MSGEEEEFEFRLRAEREAQTKTAPSPASPEKKVGLRDLLYPLDVGAHLASGAVAAPLSGYAGILGSLFPGPEGQGASWANRVGSALTFQPRTAVGALATDIIAKPFELMHRGAEAAGSFAHEKLGFEPAGAAALQTVLETVPALALAGRGKPQEALTVQQQNVANARNAGFKLTPDDMGAGVVARNAAGLAGEPKLAKLISIENRSKANELVAKDFGLSRDTTITRDLLEQIREREGTSYEKIRASGRVDLDHVLKQEIYAAAKDLKQAASELPHRAENPLLKTVDSIVSKSSLDANTIVSEIKNLRAEAKAAYAKKEAQLGRGNLDIAEALEGVLDRHMAKVGDPDALQALRESRSIIAKTYAADKALNPVTGDFNPQAYAYMLKKKIPLTGGPKIIAEAATAFPRSLQNPTGLPPSGASFFDLFLGRGLGLPATADVLSIGARPAARSLLASDLAQSSMNIPTGSLSATSLAGLLSAIKASEQERKDQGR